MSSRVVIGAQERRASTPPRSVHVPSVNGAWQSAIHPQYNRVYYYNLQTNETSWEWPPVSNHSPASSTGHADNSSKEQPQAHSQSILKLPESANAAKGKSKSKKKQDANASKAVPTVPAVKITLEEQRIAAIEQNLDEERQPQSAFSILLKIMTPTFDTFLDIRLVIFWLTTPVDSTSGSVYVGRGIAGIVIFLVSNSINTFNMHNERQEDKRHAPFMHYVMHLLGLGLVLEAGELLWAKIRRGEEPTVFRMRSMQRYVTNEALFESGPQLVLKMYSAIADSSITIGGGFFLEGKNPTSTEFESIDHHILIGGIIVGLFNVSLAAVNWEKENRWIRRWTAMDIGWEKWFHPAIPLLMGFRFCEISNRVMCLGLTFRFTKAAYDSPDDFHTWRYTAVAWAAIALEAALLLASRLAKVYSCDCLKRRYQTQSRNTQYLKESMLLMMFMFVGPDLLEDGTSLSAFTSRNTPGGHPIMGAIAFFPMRFIVNNWYMALVVFFHINVIDEYDVLGADGQFQRRPLDLSAENCSFCQVYVYTGIATFVLAFLWYYAQRAIDKGIGYCCGDYITDGVDGSRRLKISPAINAANTRPQVYTGAKP